MLNGMLPADLEDFLNTQTTADFLRAARQLIDLLEREDIDKDDLGRQALISLAHLYTTGLKLQEIPIKYSIVAPIFNHDDLFQDKNKRRIAELGEKAFYHEIFDPTYNKEKEATQGWLVDDFGDIYHDLKIELYKIDTIDTEDAVEDALWQLKWGFSHHWGNHCINALRYLHYLNFR
jgi:hypothetical protein